MKPPPELDQEWRRIEEEAFAELKLLLDDARLDIGSLPADGDPAGRLTELEDDVAELAADLMNQTFRRSTLALQRHLQEELQGPERRDQEKQVFLELAQTGRTGHLDGALKAAAAAIAAEFAALGEEVKRQRRLASDHADRWQDRVAGSGRLGLPERPGMSVLAAAWSRLRIPLADIVAELRDRDLAVQSETVDRVLGDAVS